jgi:hypothetical protein
MVSIWIDSTGCVIIILTILVIVNKIPNWKIGALTSIQILTSWQLQILNSTTQICAMGSNGETVDEIDKEYFIFLITLEKADDVCIRLNSLIKAAKFQRIKYFTSILILFHMLWLTQVTNMINRLSNFSTLLNFLVEWKLWTLSEDPMWSGCGRVFNLENAKPNLGGPGWTTRLKHSSGYTTPHLLKWHN